MTGAGLLAPSLVSHVAVVRRFGGPSRRVLHGKRLAGVPPAGTERKGRTSALTVVATYVLT